MLENISDRDHTYLKTKDNLYFSVGGNLHTPENIFGQPYYLPKKTAETMLGRQIQKTTLIENTEFCKIFDILSQSDYPAFIKENLPEYYYSPEIWPLLMRVKRQDIVQTIDPRQGLRNIRQKYQSEEDYPLIYFLKTLENYDPYLYQNTGITGSLLLHRDIDQITNDIDLVVYGQKNVTRSRDFSIAMCQNDTRFSFLDDSKFEEYLDDKSKSYPGTRKQLAALTRRRWDTYFVDETKIDFTFSPDTKSSLESYDLKPLELRTFDGVIVDAQDSYYLPTEIKVRSKSGSIEKVIITSRGYICLLQEGNQISVYGEEYISNNGDRYTVIKNSENYFLTKENE